jgi:hypothetical protein
MTTIKLPLKPRHRRLFSRCNPDRCVISTALTEKYGGHWRVGYGTARRTGFFTGVTLRMGTDAGEAAYDHDNGRNVAGRTVTLYGNPGLTLEEQAAARKKAQEDKRIKARGKAEAARKAAAAKQARAAAEAGKRASAPPARGARPDRLEQKAAAPGFWAMLWNPSAAAQQAGPQPQPQRRRMYASPGAAERARQEAARAPGR